MSQENILENVRLLTEIPKKKLPPLRSNSTKPFQKGLGNSTTSSNQNQKQVDLDNKRDSSFNRDNSQIFSNNLVQNTEPNQDLSILLEQYRQQNKHNDQELQSIANRIQFIQNQQMNVWKKTNDLYDKAISLYENKKRYQIECKMKEIIRQKKQKEIEELLSKNEVSKDLNRQKLTQNQEQLIQGRKKNAQEIKYQSRELGQMRDYFQSTIHQFKRSKHDKVKISQQQAQMKLQSYHEEKYKQFKENYNNKILQEQLIKEQKEKQIKNLEEIEKQLLDQYKRTKVQCDKLHHQIDEAQELKPEEIESKYPIFVSLAQKNIYDSNQFELQIAQSNNVQLLNTSIGNFSGLQSSQNSISPIKKNMQASRYRQYSQNKVNPLQILQQDHIDIMNKTNYHKNFYMQTSQNHGSQYSSIQPKNQKNIYKNEDGSNQNKNTTISNTRYINIYKSVNSKTINKKSNLNYSAIYEHDSTSNKDSSSIPNKEVQLNQEVNMHTFEAKEQLDQQLQTTSNKTKSPSKTNLSGNNEQNDILDHSNDRLSSSPEKNNSVKASLPSNRELLSKSPKREKHTMSQKISQNKLDLSMYQPKNQKKISLDNNNSAFLIATEADSHVAKNNRNKFNHFGEIMLNRDELYTRQRKTIQSQQKQTRSKSFVTSNKQETNSPYQRNINNNNYLTNNKF
ncbi:hypothetical protein TTHERM_00644630 (macronuclear) [Tetrahymena thermophila SB210]|uniref:Uncharacterized protein n=1 Tax=Tetrahymena thermophila (strain SB210) TaxID=312017 RepID=Q23EW7_TETTS|nr:hypothetical protein TTHERM_00644630 [Tetrahymena thermophila SB210]EAR95138.3 hypothetical protein TTHERM_00644630 [Tetrahymena thermophila SB210]|eukprot:XP_001015383.3 hypothetical protein TTHERM_00644630 [Tetrahymena thermophila SB210]